MDGGCSSHETGLAIAYFSILIRYYYEKLSEIKSAFF
jgi:hypothetical protein